MARHLAAPSAFGEVVKGKLDVDTEVSNEGRLNLICPRAINKYVNDIEELKQLIKGIKEDGLMNPIIVNRIDDYIERNEDKMTDYELEYYKKRKEQGFKYFIITGHRRFKAYCSLYKGNGEIVHTDEDLENFYEYFNNQENNKEKISVSDLLDVNPYVAIPFKIEKNGYYEEASKYNKSNMDQRSIQAFEIVDNVYDEIIKNGHLQKELEVWKNDIIDQMTDSRNAEKIFQRCNVKPQGRNLEELKKELRNVEPECFTGYQNKKIEILKSYIEREKHKLLGETSVRRSLNVLETLPNVGVKKLYDGKITFKQALSLTTMIKTKKDTIEHLKQCLEEEFDFKAYEKDIKTEKKRVVKYTPNQLVEMIKDIEKNRCSIEEVVKKLKECGMY